MTNKKGANKIKLNDKITKKGKTNKYVSEEETIIKNFIFIIVGIIIVSLGVYGVTKALKKDEVIDNNEESVQTGTIDYDVVSVGTMFNRSEDEYYVIIYDATDTQAVYYSTLINKYLNNEKSLRVYFCDLGNSLNKDYYVGKDQKSNPKAKNVNELALKELTLLKFKKGKIVKYIENVDTIKKELGI